MKRKIAEPFCPMRNSLREPVAPEAISYCDTLGNLMQVWVYLIGLMEQAEKVLPQTLLPVVKEECDSLFKQASGGRYPYCPLRQIGGVS